jgi:hypothetical protein
MMDHVSRPLIALLVGTVAFFAVWLVALKPSSSTSTGGSPALGGYQSAIDKAHRAVAVSSAAGVAHGGTLATTPTSTAAGAPAARTPTSAARPARPAPVTARVSPATGRRLSSVQVALRAGKVIALLFYNPAAADDRAVRRELAAVPGHGARVLTLAVPLSELARYTIVTNQVPVDGSPTLVVIDHAHKATTVVGFADRFEIAQRVADALATK